MTDADTLLSNAIAHIVKKHFGDQAILSRRYGVADDIADLLGVDRQARVIAVRAALGSARFTPGGHVPAPTAIVVPAGTEFTPPSPL